MKLLLVKIERCWNGREDLTMELGFCEGRLEAYSGAKVTGVMNATNGDRGRFSNYSNTLTRGYSLDRIDPMKSTNQTKSIKFDCFFFIRFKTDKTNENY